MFRTADAFFAVGIFLLSAGAGGSQPGPAGPPAPGFDVASIKPAGDSSVPLRMQHGTGGSFNATGATLLALVRAAYGVEDLQITGARGWMTSERFDVQAKMTAAPGSVTRQESRRMLQELLKQRFQLKTHLESRQMNVYEISVGKNGPKLKPWTGVQPSPDASGASQGGAVIYVKTIEALASALTNIMGRPVVDKTGLSGEYAIALAFTPEFGIHPSGNMMGAMPSAPPEPSANSISVFAALRDQLGLTMDSQKGNVEMVVIDDAVQPSAN
jgi:uncharacterized protein (TIGR03435 family)